MLRGAPTRAFVGAHGGPAARCRFRALLALKRGFGGLERMPEEGLEPPTRGLIPQRFGSTGPRNDPGGHKRGHNRGPACTLSPWVFRAACAGAASDARGFRVVVPAVTGWRLHGKKAGHVGFEVDGRDGSDLPREPADPRDSFTLRADLGTALDLLAAVPERRRKYEEIGERLLGRGRRRVCAGPCAGRRRRGGGRDRGRERRPARFLREGERPAPARPSGHRERSDRAKRPQRPRKSSNAALTSSGWVQPML